MKFMHAIALACASLVARPQPALSSSQTQAPVVVNEDWIALDLERIEQVRAFVASGTFTVEALLAAVGAHDVREDRAIGFGARRIQLALYGGHTTTWVRIFAETTGEDGVSRIARFVAVQQGYHDSWDQVSKRLAPAWGESVERVELGFRTLRNDAARDQALRQRIAKALGGPLDAKPTPDLEASFATLVDPLVQHVVGRAGGYDGAPFLAFEAMQQLVDARRFDLVRAVLCGPNPEARVYAAHALNTHDQRDESVVAAIGALSKLPLELEVQVGCIAFEAQWSKALEYLRAD